MALSIGYGLITVQRADDERRPWEEVYADALHLARFAEQCGFDSAWVSEHHLAEDGYLPSAIPFLAALAATTERMTLGTNIAIAPLYHPLRLAEDIAVVAAIARRRIILGLGLGYRDAEYEAFGVHRLERVGHLRQVVEVCRAAWASERVTVKGPGIDVADRAVRPQPMLRPEVWLGGTVDKALRRVGRLSDGYVAPTTTVEELQRRLGIAEVAAAAGRVSPLGVATNHLVSVTAGGEMDPGVAHGIRHIMDTYASWMTAGDPSMPVIVSRLQLPAQELAVYGTAEAVVDQLAPYVRAFAGQRDHHLMVRLHYPGMDRVAGERHIERFATGVAPLLREVAEAQQTQAGF